MAICRPVIDCKINDLEWPWVAIFHVKNQNSFSTSKADVHLGPTFALAIGFLVS